MKHLLSFILCLLLASAATAKDGDKLLVGRWRADVAPTGYWIIDRYADGRYAQLEFLADDLNKPSEICVSWGRWRVKGRNYEDIIDGSTSAFLSHFRGKWTKTAIDKIAPGRFTYFVPDWAVPRAEVSEPDTRPLLKIELKKPPDLYGINLQVIYTSFKQVPPWVNSHP